MSHQKWSDDQEYLSYVQDLLDQPAVQKLANYTQHHHSTRLDHSISVSYRSYLLGKKWHLNVRAWHEPVCCTTCSTTTGG